MSEQTPQTEEKKIDIKSFADDGLPFKDIAAFSKLLIAEGLESASVHEMASNYIAITFLAKAGRRLETRYDIRPQYHPQTGEKLNSPLLDVTIGNPPDLPAGESVYRSNFSSRTGEPVDYATAIPVTVDYVRGLIGYSINDIRRLAPPKTEEEELIAPTLNNLDKTIISTAENIGLEIDPEDLPGAKTFLEQAAKHLAPPKPERQNPSVARFEDFAIRTITAAGEMDDETFEDLTLAFNILDAMKNRDKKE